MSSISSIASVRDVAVVGQRSRDATSPPSQDGGQVTSTSGVQAASSPSPTGGPHTNQLGPKRLTPDQVRLVQELSQIDQKVRAHEAAHQAAAGSLGGAVSFSYETGPDGKSYAVGGEVPVDMSSGRTPQETLSHAEQIRAAALAPADPSPQDLSVAAQASEMEAAAREQIMQQQLAAMHATQTGRAGQVAVLGAQALRGRAVSLTRSGAGQAADTGHSDAAAGDGSNGGQALANPPDPSVPDPGVADVGAQSSATLATLESDRAAVGMTSVQVQQLARLASAAYGL